MTVKEIVEKIGMHNMQLEDGKIRISFPNAWTKNNIEAIKANKAEIVQYVTVEKDRIKAANDAEWEAKKAAQDAKDKPYLDAMNAKAAALRALIPAGHVFVQAEQTGDADGDPIFTFTADGMKIRQADVNIIGCASAVRYGALGAFASVYVCSIDQNKLAQIRADQQLKSAEKADKAAMRKKELAETAIPAYAMAAYKQYHGDPEKAWEAEDESASMTIKKWAPYIEAQRGMDPAKVSNMMNGARVSRIAVSWKNNFRPVPGGLSGQPRATKGAGRRRTVWIVNFMLSQKKIRAMFSASIQKPHATAPSNRTGSKPLPLKSRIIWPLTATQISNFGANGFA